MKPYEPWNYAKQEEIRRAHECQRRLAEYFERRDEREKQRRDAVMRQFDIGHER